MLPLILLMSAALPSLADLTPDELAYLYASSDTELQSAVYNAAQCQYYTWKPRPDIPGEWEDQTSFVEDKISKFAICLGGTGSGKTAAAADKTATYVLETPPPREQVPFWIIGATYDQICKVAWVEKLRHFIPPETIYGYRWYNSKLNWPFTVLLKHPDDPSKIGWTLEFKSYEQGLSAMKAESIGGYWFNEEVPFGFVAEVQGRCRDYDSPGWADFTPVECKEQAWPDAYDNPPAGWRFYHLNSLKNFYLPPDYMPRYLSTIPEDMRELRTIGRFTSLKGQVFKEFRKHIHVIDWEQFHEITGYRRIPRDWRKIRGVDFGFNNEFCCLWVAKDRDQRYYVYDEHYRSQLLIREHAKAINEREWDSSQPWYGPTFSDHDAQVRAELATWGINCTPADKRPESINSGVNLIRELMMVQGDERPKIYILDNDADDFDKPPICRNLVREINGYRWPEGTTGRNPADVPVDKNNHALDALRYAIFSDRVKASDSVPTGWRAAVDGKRHGVMASFGRGERGRAGR